MSKTLEKSLFDTVVTGGYCVGCGSCAVVNEDVSIKLDEYGQYVATSTKKFDYRIEEKMQGVCPFSNYSDDENKLSQDIYSSVNNVKYDQRIGYYLENYAGHVNKGGFRDRGSSGGTGTWILYELLEQGLIDGVIHVKETVHKKAGDPLFNFNISTSIDEVKKGAKSRYYPVEMSGVLKEIKMREGRFAIVGVSCFIKSIRLLANHDPVIKERIKYTVGLICGHKKSKRFAEMIAWQSGVHPSDLKTIDFRKKLPNRNASEYGTEVIGNVDGKEVSIIKPMKEILGYNWGHGFLKYKSCDYCDDVMNELADITIGDAWLPEYNNDYKGTNIVVVRNPIINELIQRAINSKDVHFENVSVEKVVETQRGAYGHKQKEIGFRLKEDEENGRWHPRKRDFGQVAITAKRKKIQRVRVNVFVSSHLSFKKALEQNDLDIFKKEMGKLAKELDVLYKGPLWSRVLRRSMKILRGRG